MNKFDLMITALRNIDLLMRRFRSSVKTGVVTGEDMETHIRDVNRHLNAVRHLIIQRSKKRRT
jgi:hypothetical protein